ncbi:MAG: RHS repeat-associated core domain-containing protein [Chitinophagaceae bacterium]|nr:RHS repeat-associated core domain-containing protein [Chitinophagaceae bacterium]
MHSIQNIYTKEMCKCRLALLVLFSICSVTALGQNLNNPNKGGPLGTQVNTLSGNLFIPRTDIYIPARSFDLDIRFYYNSFLFTEEYGYGKGWTFEYNIRYKQDTIPGSKLILWGDGREDQYDSIPGGSYKTPRGFFNTLSQYQPGKYVLTELNGVKYFFDNAVHKRITRMEEPNGNYINFTYTDSLLTAMTNAAGQTIGFTYNPQGRLATVVDAIAVPSRTFTYTYDAGGNLKEVKDPLNNKYQYSYLINGPMKSLADKNNNKVDIIYFPDFTTRELIGCNKRLSFSYDTISKTTFVTDHLSTGNQVTKYKYKTVENLSWITSMSGNCCGFNMSYEYDDQGNQTKMTDANGQVYTYTYDEFGNMLTATDPLNQISTYTYTTDYKKINSFKDPKGNLYTIGYDSRGNMTQLVTPGNNVYTATYNANGDIINSTDPRGNIYTYNYDSRGNPINVTGPNGYQAALSFDARGNLLSYTDARGNTSSAEYDILDRLKKITDPINNNVQFTYDAQGNPVIFKNKNNETTTLNFDASNRLVNITGPTGNQSSYTYDGMNNLLSAKNALGHEVKMSYDNRNRLKSAKDPDNNNAAYTYDGNGNILSVSLANGRQLNYTYDLLNRLTEVSDGTSSIASFVYDKNGNITSYTNATGAIITAAYDSLDRMKSITDPLGNSSHFTYDKNNNIISVTDREGRTSFYNYDSLNRVKTFTDNNGFVTTVGYDAQSNITSLTDQNNNTTTYTYDSLNRRKRMTFPDAMYTEFTYDKESNITAIRRTDATVINYQYDTLNRVTSRTMPGGEVYTYTYDKMSRVLTATNNNGTITFTYDKLNRVTSENFDGRTTRYGYNVSGRTQTTIYPDSTTVIKEFDTRNRLTKILKDSVTVAEYSYNNANQLTQKSFANGVSSNMQYDYANRLSSLTTTAASGVIQNSQFSYDKEYNKTAITRSNNSSLSEQFTYDNGYRLTNYKRGPAGSPVIQNTYTYDAVGNRTAANLNGAATTYAVNNLNQLTGVNSTSFSFDDRGNLTYDGTFYKTYDAENRLVKDSSSPASVVTYGYDASNRRITKTINGNTLKYTYSGASQIEERNSSNVLLNRTVFTGFLSPVMNEKSGNKFYYHPNELGSVEAISNNSGRLLESYRYDVYGKMTRYDSLNNPLSGSLAGNRFGFTGQEFDSATNSYRFFYRNYSPETGVFNQRDLIEYGDGMGMYQYVGNNPANGVDVLGLKCPEKGHDRTDISFTVSAGGAVLHDKVGGERIMNEVDRRAEIKIKETPRPNRAERRRLELRGEESANIRKYNEVNSKASVTKASRGLKLAGGLMNLADNLVKFEKLASSMVDGQGNEQNTEEWANFADLVLSASGWTPQGAIAGLADFGIERLTGQGLVSHGTSTTSFLTHTLNSWQYDIPMVWQYGDPIDENWRPVWSSDWWTYDYHFGEKPCPPSGGSRNSYWNKFANAVNGLSVKMLVLLTSDPNEIKGPDGQPNKAWVSVKDRMPYTILFENDTTATAPVKYLKITSPVEPKQDPATLELGNVGFNNSSFDIPPGNSFYYQRLDARDSTGLFIDMTAGYDIVTNNIFWEFQAIDPITLLPPEDPMAGFVFVQDTLNPEYGHGFVNFSIKPKTSSQTLDTIGARAFIVFDENDTIPTNIHKNTIDAVAPTSSIMNLPDLTPDTEVRLTYTGTDDPNGSGVKHYSIYVADDNGPPELYLSNITVTDTVFYGIAEHTYKFYITASDTAGNVEELHLLDSVKITNGQYVICPGANVSFDSKMTGSTFQWQVDNGTGYTNVTNGGIYSGATTAILDITNPPTNMYGFKYRCLVNGTTYSLEFILKFGMTWEGTVSTAWENPANWSCNSLPDMNTDVIINGGKPNYPVVTSNPTIRTLRLNAGATGTVSSGFTLTVVK